jgi:hypothetical protein
MDPSLEWNPEKGRMVIESLGVTESQKSTSQAILRLAHPGRGSGYLVNGTSLNGIVIATDADDVRSIKMFGIHEEVVDVNHGSGQALSGCDCVRKLRGSIVVMAQ